MPTADKDAARLAGPLVGHPTVADDDLDDDPGRSSEDEEDEEDDASEAALDRAYRRQLTEDPDAIGDEHLRGDLAGLSPRAR